MHVRIDIIDVVDHFNNIIIINYLLLFYLGQTISLGRSNFNFYILMMIILWYQLII